MEDIENTNDYFSYLPPEILELIFRHFDARDLSRLRQGSTLFKNLLDSPTSWRLIFNERFKKRLYKVKFIDDYNINWREEMARLTKLEKNACNFDSKPITRSYTSGEITSLKIHKNRLMVNGFAPLDIKSCLKKKSFNLANDKYSGHLVLGPYAGQVEPDPHGGHQIIDLWHEETPTIYKKIFTADKGRLISFNSNLAVLAHENNTYSIWNLLVLCKHTDERLWKKASNKRSSCETCALLGYISVGKNEGFGDICCSQVDPTILLIPAASHLQVRRPIDGTSLDITFDDTAQIKVDPQQDRMTYPIPPKNYEYFARIVNEQKIKINGKRHHIVHCIVNQQHRFYSLRNQKLMAAIDCWNYDKWIPNTSYFAMATVKDVIVMDFHHQRIVSHFSPRAYRTRRGNVVKDYIYGLYASSLHPVLIIAMDRALICSALTGVQFELSNWRVNSNNIALTEDEKTLVNWSWSRIGFWDLKEALICLCKSLNK